MYLHEHVCTVIFLTIVVIAIQFAWQPKSLVSLFAGIAVFWHHTARMHLAFSYLCALHVVPPRECASHASSGSPQLLETES